MFAHFNIKIFFITLVGFIFINSFAHSANWKREDNIECSIKTNHPELLEANPSCTSWSTNYQYQQTFYLKTNKLIFYGRLQLAQPGYFWYNSGQIQKKLNQFNFIKNNVKFKKSSSNPVLSSNFWSRKPDNFDVEINNSKYRNTQCFGFWDGSSISSSIGRRYNIYGMICNTNDEEINTSISSFTPLPLMYSSAVPVTSSEKRTHRVHIMQRSPYSIMLSPTSFLLCVIFSVSQRRSPRPYSYA